MRIVGDNDQWLLAAQEAALDITPGLALPQHAVSPGLGMLGGGRGPFGR